MSWPERTTRNWDQFLMATISDGSPCFHQSLAVDCLITARAESLPSAVLASSRNLLPRLIEEIPY